MILPLLAMALLEATTPSGPRFLEVSSAVGLDALNVQRLAVADLDNDGRPDLIVSRDRVFLSRRDEHAEPGVRFAEVTSGLKRPGDDGVSVYADLDGDGSIDAFSVLHLDAKERATRESAGDTSPVAWWQRGRGDGTFDAPVAIDMAGPRTAASIAAGDVDRDGRTDLLIGNWYERYGEGNEAFAADLLLNLRADDGSIRFERSPLPEDAATFDEEHDLAGRPVYGTLIAELLDPTRFRPPQLLELAYGRRWNRLYARDAGRKDAGWSDTAPLLGLDGDANRSGEYPAWLAERAKTDPRFARETEKPFRANGNTFDAAVGDLDNDGRFDLLVVEIAHAWAGDSSDRTRVLLQRPAENPCAASFESASEWSLDRIPTTGDPTDLQRWNQGDLFGEFGDFDLDGRLDVLIASGDYPDPPPFDERLRLFIQRTEPGDDGRRFVDRTADASIDQIGCGQIAVADFDLDGRLDIVAAQSFNRFTPEMVKAAGGTPRLRLWLNRTGGQSPPPTIALRLVGDPSRGIATQPFGAIVMLENAGLRQWRQLMGPGGHAGKECEPLIHAALPTSGPTKVEITWPSTPPRTTRLELQPGRHAIRAGEVE